MYESIKFFHRMMMVSRFIILLICFRDLQAEFDPRNILRSEIQDIIISLKELSERKSVVKNLTIPNNSRYCARRLLSQCSDGLYWLAETQHVAFATSEEVLDQACRSSYLGLDCIEDYTIRCFSQSQYEVYRYLIQGAIDVLSEICQQTQFRFEFLRHSNCLRKSVLGHAKCNELYYDLLRGLDARRNYRMLNDEMLRDTCCSYSTFIACGTRRMAKNCGQEAADFVTSYTQKASGRLIQDYCLPHNQAYSDCEALENHGNTLALSGIFLISCISIIKML
ncbi:uncharacterized protein LOC136028753 [Artemia franciscana]|uniref:uncharacterized protein LOC136028753 n=1 Tax=Artemia franciscana TaxID=6661 RepID=UPI0032DB9940